MSSHIQIQAIREEGGSSSGHSDMSTHNTSHDTIKKLAPCPPVAVAWNPHRRRDSSVSWVDFDFFDPVGVRELQLTLTHLGQDFDVGGKASLHRASDVILPVGDGPFDFERTFRNLVEQHDEAKNKKRELGVLFQDLHVVGLASSASYQPTLGSVLDPRNLIHSIKAMRHPSLRNILTGFEGVVRPGEMLLVLGRPGSGCSTFLKTLANQRDEFYSVSGDVHYDSLSPADIAKHYRGDVQYCPEDDVHFPTLTVQQTLAFAAKTRAPQTRLRSRKSYIELYTEALITIFGLKHAKHILVGDEAIRGVSGGEKKRVSIAEALATRSLVGAWDNSTRGLNASIALEFGRALRIATDMCRLTTIVSIYQAGETLYQLFDKVCVIKEGRMAYFGPADQARQYFIDMGYQPTNRQTTSDFLLAVTDPNCRIPRPGVGGQPRSAEEFAEYFRGSNIAELGRDDMKRYREECVGSRERIDAYKESALAERADNARNASPYTISIPMQVRAVMTRKVQILMGNKLATILKLISSLLYGIIVGTAFLRVAESTSAYFSLGGVLFYSLLFSALSSMAEIPALFTQRPIVLRHQKAAMYHPFIEAVASTLVDIPITFTTVLVFAVMVYFIVGLQPSASQFFVFYLFLFTTSITMKAWFRATAAAFKSEATSLGFSGVILLGLIVYTGFMIPSGSMIGALRWISYINPLRYGFEGTMANEFHTLNGSCTSLVPRGPGYEGVSLANQVCATVGAVAGENFVDGNKFIELSYGYSYANTWKNLVIVGAFGMASITAFLFFTEFNTSLTTDTFVVLFKRGTNITILEGAGTDEEKADAGGHSGARALHSGRDRVEAEKGLAEQPFMTDVFSWEHICYDVPGQGGQCRLLDDVSGFVAPGKLTALMGESGAGKTMLLNVLAERISIGVVTGDRFVNGHSIPTEFQAQSGYCQQIDTHVPTDTVREALLFSAKLRQPASVPLAEKEAYVELCLKMCGLEAFGDAMVGSLGIEHRKRTTIGVELAAKPKLLLFLDEPTSGLDSRSAWSIVSFLRSLSDNGQAILCTIHQPSAELFQVFDRLLLLRNGGQTVYFGDIGHDASTLIQYFEKNGSRSCAPDENPAEFMLDVIGASATASNAQDWYDIWRGSQEFKDIQREVDAIHSEGRNRPLVESSLHAEFATSWLNQMTQLFKRDALNHWRHPSYLLAKLLLNIIGGLFTGFTFFKSNNTQQGTQNKLFAIYMGTILSGPLCHLLQVPFLKIRSVYEIRERRSRMYSWTALVTSQILAETPWNILGSSLFFLCWYWMVGFESSRAGYTYFMFGFLFPVYYTSLAQATASMVPNVEAAAIVFSFVFSFVLTFNGVIQPYREPGWWQWMYHLSPYTHFVGGVLGQAIGRQSITCAAVELVTLVPPSGQTCGEYLEPYITSAGGYLTNFDATSGCEFCPFATTDQFLESNFNISYADRWRNLGMLFALSLFNIAAVYGFTYLFRIRTGSLLGSLKKCFIDILSPYIN